MEFMDGTTEIDESGRMVVPKKVRDAMRVSGRTKVFWEFMDGAFVVKSDGPEPKLVKKDGLWVYDSGVRMPDTPEYDPVRMIEEDRERRLRYVAGEISEP